MDGQNQQRATHGCDGDGCIAGRSAGVMQGTTLHLPETHAVLASCLAEIYDRILDANGRSLLRRARVSQRGQAADDLGIAQEHEVLELGVVVADAELEAADPVAVAFAGGTAARWVKILANRRWRCSRVSGGALASAGSFSSPIT